MRENVSFMNLDEDQEIDDDSFPIPNSMPYDVCSWWQTFSASINSIHDDSKQDLHFQVHNSIPLKRLDMNFIHKFNKRGILTKCSIIRAIFRYQIILEKMTIQFKSRISKCIPSDNRESMIQNEMDLFVTYLNHLTTKCEVAINQSLNAPILEQKATFKPITDEEKYRLTDYLFQMLRDPSSVTCTIEEFATSMNMNLSRVKKILREKKNMIAKYLNDENELPKWMMKRYSEQLAAMKIEKNAIQEIENQPIPDLTNKP